MAFVLDASAALPWCFQDEATSATERLLELAEAGERIYVPAHWATEVLNGLTRGVRRGRLDDAEVNRFLEYLPAFNLVVDRTPMVEHWHATRPLISSYRLSAYDAAYLELAKRHSVRLATLDSRLRTAAVAEGLAFEF